MQSSALKLYPSFEQKAMLLKRQAFAVFSGEIDQYHLYLPLIQGKSCGLLSFSFSSNKYVNIRKENGSTTFLSYIICFRTTDWEPPCWADFFSCRTDVPPLQSSIAKDFSSASDLLVANYGNWIGKE